MRETVLAVRAAWLRRDAGELARSLTRDVVLLVDAGGRVPVPVRRATGAAAVASALVGLIEALSADGVSEAAVNGAPGLTLLSGDRVVGVVGVAVRGRAVSHVWAVVNPAKLANWNG